MKCKKCGLDPGEQHTLEYYSGCSRCSDVVRRTRISSGRDWKHVEGHAPLTSDCFCQDCGKLLIAPALLCLSCDSKKGFRSR